MTPFNGGHLPNGKVNMTPGKNCLRPCRRNGVIILAICLLCPLPYSPVSTTNHCWTFGKHGLIEQ